MTPARPFIYTLRHELVTKRFLYIALPIAIIYALLTIYIFNYHLVIQTLFGIYPVVYKITLMLVLLQGFWTLFSPFDLFLLALTALLVGINCMIAASTIQRIKQQGNIAFSVGGASLIGLATAGCSTCGLTLFSVFGISSAVSFLPFHGLELHFLAVILLFVSAFYMLRKLHEEVYCDIASNKHQKVQKKRA